jgi:glycosyltransferase involved in cell wall biosynthesis
MRLSVVIGTYNRIDSLKRCIQSIFDQTRTEVLVYVTDAGSSDGTQDYLTASAHDRLVPLLVGRRVGQAKAYNEVFKAINTPYVAWLSDDNEVVNGGLDLGVLILDRRAEIGMVGLKVRDVVGPFAEAPYIGGISSIGVLNVNQGLVRTDVLRKVGYFSETFGFYGIDPDLTAMVLYSGHDVVYTRAVALHHHRTWLTDESDHRYAAQKRQQEKWVELYRRKYEGFGATDMTWRRKKWFWSRLRRTIARFSPPDSTTPFLGGLYRDWQNAFSCRHIPLLDPWRTIGCDFHLRQHVPRHQLPRTLPSDPEPTE